MYLAECKDLQVQVQDLESQLAGIGEKHSQFRYRLETVLQVARHRIEQLEKEIVKERLRRDDINQSKSASQKTVSRVPGRMERAKEKAVKEVTTQTMKVNGIITPAMRLALAKLVQLGAPEENADAMLHVCCDAVNIRLVDHVDERSVRRIIGEIRIAAEIQIVRAIQDAIAAVILGDGTSHRGLNYEVMGAATINKHTGEKAVHFLGINLSRNHSSEEQLRTWQEFIDRIYDTYNSSPTGQKHSIGKEEFYQKVQGTLTDHAADQKKLASLFEKLKRSVERETRGRHAINTSVTAEEVLGYISAKNEEKIRSMGGIAGWEALSEAEKLKRNEQTYQEILIHFGELDFEKLPDKEKANVDFYVSRFCCMHKDLNAHKGGTERMAQYWVEKNKEPPILLMNKDNDMAAALGTSAAKTQAEKNSSRGGVKTTELMGLLFRHKDSKKGHQERTSIYFEAREHSHADAAAEIMVHLPIYREILEFVRDEKTTLKFNHLELNVYKALHDIPTLTELAAHALYGQSVTYPYMREARKSGTNHFDLRPLHVRLLAHLQKVLNEPQLLCGPGPVLYETASLDGRPWERPEAVYAILASAKNLLELPGVLQYLFEGALETWKRFASDVLDQDLPADISDRLYAPATADTSEGGLGMLRKRKVYAPNSTLDTNNSIMHMKRNNTVEFVRNELTDTESQRFLRKRQREREREGNEKKRRKQVAEATREKVKSNREKKEKRKIKKAAREERLRKCVPMTDVPRLQKILSEIQKNPHSKESQAIKVPEIELQLVWHRDRLSRADKTATESMIPSTSKCSKKEKLETLIQVIEGWNKSRGSSGTYVCSDLEDSEDSEGAEDDVESDSDLLGYTRG
ncbi:hypothetical protein K435DRAFT_768328 [Dendrothele bispora CBS 962.96]|uniref:Uncharacterized protein n=1 Tax=Dendrothele bispora (strain CBS 962.96) TaxID=1314807 RepID=A0A4S8KX13_DENBC|nr:hypothetical protein K435DRAFT_768328 [Dendrothele bispora CBS 962.96]